MNLSRICKITALAVVSIATGTSSTIHAAAIARASEPVVADGKNISVIDGDTIQIGTKVYQLAGIDAPELGQACNHDGDLWLCGLAAGYRLRKQLELEAAPIRCFVQKSTAVLPLTACLIGDQELSVNLLKSGSVLAEPDGPPHYAASEHLAKQASLGIWGSTFVPPWEWRKGKRLPNEHEFTGSLHPTEPLPWKGLEQTFLHLKKAEHAACMVKGEITSTGQRYYYSPLDPEYPSIAISPEKGERYFCGDEEARHAGWKRKGESR